MGDSTQIYLKIENQSELKKDQATDWTVNLRILIRVTDLKFGKDL